MGKFFHGTSATTWAIRTVADPYIAKDGDTKMATAVASDPTTGRRGTAAYFLARLDRDRPDLAVRVRNRDLTANAAAIEAGFRKPQLTLPDNLEDAAAALLRRWGPGGARRIARLLEKMASQRINPYRPDAPR